MDWSFTDKELEVIDFDPEHYTFSSSKEESERYVQDVFDKAKADKPDKWVVTVADLYDHLGLWVDRSSVYETQMGWSWMNESLHHLSTRELHPDFCPCCGRPW